MSRIALVALPLHTALDTIRTPSSPRKWACILFNSRRCISFALQCGGSVLVPKFYTLGRLPSSCHRKVTLHAAVQQGQIQKKSWSTAQVVEHLILCVRLSLPLSLCVGVCGCPEQSSSNAPGHMGIKTVVASTPSSCPRCPPRRR